GFGVVMEVFRAFFFVWAIGIFLYSVCAAFILGQLRNPESEPLVKRNIAEHLSYALAKHLLSAGNAPNASEVMHAAAQTKRGAFFLRAMGLDPETVAERFIEYGGDEEEFEVVRFFKVCRKMTQTLEEPVINGHVVLYTFLSKYEAGHTLVRKADLAQEDLSALLEWETLRYYNRKGKAGLTPEAVQDPSRTIGRFWSFGYTNTLDEITQDVTQRLQYREPYEVVIHQDQLKRGLSVLLQAERNNLMLLGDIGVGKHTFVENVAHRLFQMEFKKDRVPTRILTLNIPEFLSGTQKPDTFFLQALTEAEQAGNIVLVIDEISVLLKGENSNLRQILQRFLDSSRISIVGIENSSNYHTIIKDNSQFTRSFEVLTLPEIDKDTTYQVLMMEAVRIEHTQHIQITYQSLKQIYRFCDSYMIQESFPGKGVDTLQK
ncbi:MAG: AAA family ATPase, partial [Candidatus Paceibacteria bacterium]